MGLACNSYKAVHRLPIQDIGCPDLNLYQFRKRTDRTLLETTKTQNNKAQHLRNSFCFSKEDMEPNKHETTKHGFLCHVIRVFRQEFGERERNGEQRPFSYMINKQIIYIITSPPTFQKHIWSSWESLLVCQVAAKTSTLSMQMIKLVKILLCEK